MTMRKVTEFYLTLINMDIERWKYTAENNEDEWDIYSVDTWSPPASEAS